jgi:hypothetical protein
LAKHNAIIGKLTHKGVFGIDMDKNNYTIQTGRLGNIPKAVVFAQTDVDYYEIILGDYDALNKHLDTHTVSNNGDIALVLITVAQIIALFFQKYPQAHLVIEANTPLKHKLYKRIIDNNLAYIETKYVVWGVLDMIIQEPYQKEGEYRAFVFELKP